MMTPDPIHDFTAALIERVVDLVLRAAGGPAQLPRSNEDFGFY